MAATESQFDALIEETFEFIKRLDETDDSAEAVELEARIAERSELLGSMEGWGVFGIDESLLTVCLDRDQAVAIQQALLITEGGFVTTVAHCDAPLFDFCHPETSVALTVAILTDPDADEEA